MRYLPEVVSAKARKTSKTKYNSIILSFEESQILLQVWNFLGLLTLTSKDKCSNRGGEESSWLSNYEKESHLLFSCLSFLRLTTEIMSVPNSILVNQSLYYLISLCELLSYPWLIYYNTQAIWVTYYCKIITMLSL